MQNKSHSDRFRHNCAYSGIFRHNQAYSGIIQAYSEPCVTLVCSELWHIQNHGIFKTRGILRTLVYPKLWQIHTQRHIQNPGLFIWNSGIFRTEGILRTLSNIYNGAHWETVNDYNYFPSYNFFTISAFRVL